MSIRQKEHARLLLTDRRGETTEEIITTSEVFLASATYLTVVEMRRCLMPGVGNWREFK